MTKQSTIWLQKHCFKTIDKICCLSVCLQNYYNSACPESLIVICNELKQHIGVQLIGRGCGQYNRDPSLHF